MYRVRRAHMANVRINKLCNGTKLSTGVSMCHEQSCLCQCCGGVVVEGAQGVIIIPPKKQRQAGSEVDGLQELELLEERNAFSQRRLLEAKCLDLWAGQQEPRLVGQHVAEEAEEEADEPQLRSGALLIGGLDR